MRRCPDRGGSGCRRIAAARRTRGQSAPRRRRSMIMPGRVLPLPWPIDGAGLAAASPSACARRGSGLAEAHVAGEDAEVGPAAQVVAAVDVDALAGDPAGLVAQQEA